MKPVRSHAAYWAFLVHRLSGIALALFLPLHFWFLGSALQGEAAMDEMLRWTEQPAVVAGEWALIVLLAAHLAGGLRVLALEFLPWRNWQKTLAALAAGFALIAGLAFALAR
jgi:fumarate reductase subunit D